MDIMLPTITKGASLKEIKAMIATRDSWEDNPSEADDGGATSWLVSGLRIQDTQFVLHILISSPDD